jgi:hypothetical protein
MVVVVHHQQAGALGRDVFLIFYQQRLGEEVAALEGIRPERAGTEAEGIPEDLKTEFPGKGIA